jgi:hypothetical protein
MTYVDPLGLLEVIPIPTWQPGSSAHITSLEGCHNWFKNERNACYRDTTNLWDRQGCLDDITKEYENCVVRLTHIFICRRKINEDVKCSPMANACGGQHTYIQFGWVNEDGTPCEGTEGCGFSGGTVLPGITLPSDEKAFKPDVCWPIILPPGTSAAQAENCIRGYPIQHHYSTWKYNCNHWAQDVVKHCGLKQGNPISR